MQAIKRQQDPRDAVYADERGHSVNANVGAAIKLHKKLQREVDAISRKANATDEEVNRVCRTAHNAFRAVGLSSPRNMGEALERVLYIEKHWRKMTDPHHEGDFHTILSFAVRALGDFRAGGAQ
jgi:hypothetical protein